MNIMATWFPGRSAAEVGGGVAVGFRHHGRGWCGVGVGGAGLVWFCFLQRPRLIAVYEVRVLGGGGGAKDTVQETYSLHFLFSLTV